MTCGLDHSLDAQWLRLIDATERLLGPQPRCPETAHMYACTPGVPLRCSLCGLWMNRN